MQLTIGTSVIPLDAGARLPLVWRSPLFLTSENKIPGSYIFNFQVPAGDAIRSVFGQAHRVQRHGRATAELPYIITDGSLRFVGNCIVTEADSDKYEISCKVDNGDLAGKLSGKTLKDLDWGADKIISDLFSIALAKNFNAAYYDPEESGIFPFAINETLIVINDITSSMGSDGRTFTSASNITCKQIITLAVAFTYGSIRLIAKKNGVEYLNNYYSMLPGGVLPTTEIMTELTLVIGDVITIELEGETETINPIGTQADMFIGIWQVEYKKTNLFTQTSALDQDTSDFAIFPIHNKSFLDNFPEDAFALDNLSIKTIYTDHFPVLNYFKNGEFPLMLSGVAESEPFVCANLFTPFIYLRTILNKIASEAGYTIQNNPFDAEFTNAVLFNAFAENTYSSNTTTILPIKATFNLIDHVPDISQSDFLKWISILTGYMPVVDNNRLTITFVSLKDKHLISLTNPAIPFPGIMLPNPIVKVEPEYKGIKFELKKAGTDKYLDNIKELNDKLIYKGEVEHLNNLPSSGNVVNDLYLVTSMNEYYVFQYNPEVFALTWWFHSKKFPLIYTEGEEPYLTVTSELCPVLTSRLLDETVGAPANRTWTIPRTEQAGILEGFPDSLSAEYGLQVLYYKGMVNDSLSQPYPLGSARMADYASNPDSSPDLSADGIFTSRYSGLLRWLAYDAKPVRYKAILTRAQLKQIQFDQVYSGTGFNFLVKEIRINMGIDGLSVGEVDILSV